MDLADQILAKQEELRALVAKASLSCKDGRHDWQSIGGRNAGCEADRCSCSVPVHRCATCGDYDYGENAEAEQTVRQCAIARDSEVALTK